MNTSKEFYYSIVNSSNAATLIIQPVILVPWVAGMISLDLYIKEHINYCSE
jgi:hypothetical protein